jgi:hypothetical protein
MEEVIVEGLDYEDFKSLKTILSEHTYFKHGNNQLFADNNILIQKIEKIIQVFEE